MSLRLLLDSANPLIWEQWISSGLFSGITTNPTLLKQAGQPCNFESIRDLATKAQTLGYREIHFQAWGETYQKQYECGLSLGKLSRENLDVYVKVPITLQGSQVAKKLMESNLSITFTACYEVQQVLIAASIGVKYIAPYMGRMSDLGIDALSELISMQRTLKNIGSTCEILVASIRNKNDIIKLANEGLNTFTLSPQLAEDLFDVNETIRASEDFEKAAKNI